MNYLFLSSLPGKVRRSKRLATGLIILITIMISPWACNSPAVEPVVQAEVTAAPQAESRSVTQNKTNNDDNASPDQAEADLTSAIPASPPQTEGNSDTVVESLLPDSQHIEGDPNAPVTIIEFSDFKCPFCARFAVDSLPWIREYYIKTGSVRFAYSHTATLGPESSRAAEASECAAEQDQFWAYHDRVFANQLSEGSELNNEMLVKLAAEVALDTANFKECLTSGRYADRVKQQTQEAQLLGVRATPGFMINNSFMVGTQPYDTFAKVINRELEKLGWEAPAGAADGIQGLIVYPPDPPPADILNGVWQNCGIYDETVSIDNVLSSLVHGAVWVAYHPELPVEQVEILRDIVRRALAQGDEPMVILSPGPYTDRQIVVSAWRVQLSLEEVSDPRLEQFLEKFQVGPFTPEPGEPCSGGVGRPLD